MKIYEQKTFVSIFKFRGHRIVARISNINVKFHNSLFTTGLLIFFERIKSRKCVNQI